MSQPLVRASCPGCGDVVLTTGDLGLDEQWGEPRLTFACPRCREQVSHDIPSGIVHILRAAGVRRVVPLAQPLGDDELANFLADFDRTDCLDQLRRLTPDA
ncbi:MAG: hypothetical protein ACRDZ8_09600 [Acidimicrobiales bacterium]